MSWTRRDSTAFGTYWHTPEYNAIACRGPMGFGYYVARVTGSAPVMARRGDARWFLTRARALRWVQT